MNDVNQAKSVSSPAAATPTAARRRRRWWFKPAALLFALLIIFAIGEAVVRCIHGAPLVEHDPLLIVQASPHTGWTMLPNTPHYMYHHRVAVNSLGLRGPRVVAKREGECRVLALGDSMVYGQGVADDETLPHYLEQSLMEQSLAQQAAAGPSFTVINGGLRGFSTNQELGLLKALGPVIEPDVVVLFYYWNDVIEHSIAEVNQNLSRSGPVVFETKTKLQGWDRVKWDVRKLIRRSALVMWLHDALRGGDERLIESEVALGMRRLNGYLGEMKAMGERQGFELLVAIVPSPNQLRGAHQSGQVDDRATAVCEAAGVPVLRLLDAAKSADEGGMRLPVVPYDGHYNAEANKAMAERVAAEVMKRMKVRMPRSKWAD